MLSSPNLFLIGAADRNVGKTEFACMLINQTCKTHSKVIGIKVTTVKNEEKGTCPRGGQGCGVCSSLLEDYCITNETNSDSSKDTARMLCAGASAVYWLRIREKALEEGTAVLLKKIEREHGNGIPIVCESNSLRKVLTPGLFFVLNRLNNPNIKESCKSVESFAEKKVTLISIDKGFDFDLNTISFENNRWYFRTDASCIILAGGKSSRMGTDKTKLTINGTSLIEHIIKQLKPIFREIIISSNKPEELSYLKLTVLKDSIEGYGPLMGICKALKHSKSDRNFVIACDIPAPDINLIYKLLAIDASFDAVIPRHQDNFIEPLFAVYSKKTLPAIEESLETERQIRAFFKKVKVLYIETDTIFFNINSIDDYDNFIKKGRDK